MKMSKTKREARLLEDAKQRLALRHTPQWVRVRAVALKMEHGSYQRALHRMILDHEEQEHLTWPTS